MMIQPYEKLDNKTIDELLDDDLLSNYLKKYLKKYRTLPRRCVLINDNSTKCGYKIQKYPKGWTKEKREKQRQIALSMKRDGNLFSGGV